MNYIDKDRIVAEIEKWQDEIKKGIFSIPLTGSDRAYAAYEYEILGKVKSVIDTIKVKEVDLEKEIMDYFDNQPIVTRSGGVAYQLIPSAETIAKHFFALGLKAQKGE